MNILKDSITIEALNDMAKSSFGDMVKAVVDIKQNLIALDAELHSDLEALLLENGSQPNELWGINLYPEIEDDDFLEFDSMINMRPNQGNASRGVDSLEIRDQIRTIVNQQVIRS